MTPIKYEKATMAAINRFPMLYRMQAYQAIEREVRRAVRIAADSVQMANMLVLIEDGYGTRVGSTRLENHVKRVSEIVDLAADFFDDGMAEGLRNRLHLFHSVEYGEGGK